jgi:hypothetical protein
MATRLAAAFDPYHSHALAGASRRKNTHRQADHCRDSNDLPWILVDIAVGSPAHLPRLSPKLRRSIGRGTPGRRKRDFYLGSKFRNVGRVDIPQRLGQVLDIIEKLMHLAIGEVTNASRRV